MPPSLRYLQDRWEEPPEEWEGDPDEVLPDPDPDDPDEDSYKLPEVQPKGVDEEDDSAV